MKFFSKLLGREVPSSKQKIEQELTDSKDNSFKSNSRNIESDSARMELPNEEFAKKPTDCLESASDESSHNRFHLWDRNRLTEMLKVYETSD